MRSIAHMHTLICSKLIQANPTMYKNAAATELVGSAAAATACETHNMLLQLPKPINPHQQLSERTRSAGSNSAVALIA